MRHFLTFLYILIFSIFSNCSVAQNAIYRVINNLNGLPSNTVYSILQDKNGFLWIAHDKGLSRYDGKSFVHYQSIAKQGRSLFNLMEYQDRIYCQDFAGNFYYTQQDKLVKESTLTWKGGFVPATILNNKLLISCFTDTLRTLNLATKKISKIPIPSTFTWGINVKSHKLLALCKNGIYRTDGYRGQFQKLPTYQSFFLIPTDNELFGITKTQYPYVRRLLHGGAPISVLKPNLFIQDVIKLKDEIWVSTSSGAYCFDLNFNPKYNGFCFFEGTSISRILLDREGNYWFATLSKGLLFVPNIHTRLYQYQNTGMTALAPFQEGRGVYIGTEKQNILSFSPDQGFSPFFMKKLSNHEVISIYEDTENHDLFFSSNRLVHLNAQHQLVQSLEFASKSIVKIKSNLYAMAYSGGVALLTKSRKPISIPSWLLPTNSSTKYLHIDTVFHLTHPSIKSRTRWIEFGRKDSTLYISTVGGLVYISPKSTGNITYQGNPIYGSQIINQGDYTYVSTFSEGMYIIKKQQVIQHISTKDGLASNTIYRFQIDQQKLWLAEEGMLQSFDLKTKEITSYSSTDGLPKAEIKDLVVGAQNIFLATPEGLVVFDKKRNVINKTSPLMVLTGFTVNAQKRDYYSGIKLESDQNSIEIFFSILSFKSEDELRISYKINNGTWLNLPSQSRVLSFPSLSPGAYQLKLKVINEDGIEVQKPLDIDFEINAPFYLQWWFVGLILAIITLGIYWYFRWRINDINQKNQLIADKLKLEQEVKQSMLASIKSQMNPHFLFNALNTIQAYIYTNDKENASVYLGKFSELTRRILDMSNKDCVPLSEEIKALNLYLELEKIRFEDLLHYTFEVDPALQPDFVHIPSMLIQPYVENAIKHGLLHKKEDRQLWIKFIKERDCLMVIIEDNGIGRKRSAQLKRLKEKNTHNSFAISANQKRLDILNQGAQYRIMMEIIDKHNAQGEPSGTLVNIRIPFQKSPSSNLVN